MARCEDLVCVEAVEPSNNRASHYRKTFGKESAIVNFKLT